MPDSSGQLEKLNVAPPKKLEPTPEEVTRLHAILDTDDIETRNGDDSLALVRLLGGPCGARLFQHLPDDAVAKALGFQLHPRTCKPYEVILRQGHEPHAAYILLDGEVQTWRRCHFGDPLARQAIYSTYVHIW